MVWHAVVGAVEVSLLVTSWVRLLSFGAPKFPQESHAMCVVSVSAAEEGTCPTEECKCGTSAPGHFHIAIAPVFCSYFNVALETISHWFT